MMEAAVGVEQGGVCCSRISSPTRSSPSGRPLPAAQSLCPVLFVSFLFFVVFPKLESSQASKHSHGLFWELNSSASRHLVVFSFSTIATVRSPPSPSLRDEAGI